MKQFIFLYFLFLALLFGLFYAPIWSVSDVLNEAQTKLTLFFLNVFLETNQLQGIDIYIHEHYKIVINKACFLNIKVLKKQVKK